MKITVDGGSFNIAIETEYNGLIDESTAVYHATRAQAKTTDKTLLRFLQIILEHRDDDDAIGYAVLGLLGWYHITINPLSDHNITLNLPRILPHLLNPQGDRAAPLANNVH